MVAGLAGRVARLAARPAGQRGRRPGCPRTTSTSASYPRCRRPFDRPSPIAAAAPLEAATSAGTVPVTGPSSITASAYLPWALAGPMPASAPEINPRPNVVICRRIDMRISTRASGVMPASASRCRMPGDAAPISLVVKPPRVGPTGIPLAAKAASCSSVACGGPPAGTGPVRQTNQVCRVFDAIHADGDSLVDRSGRMRVRSYRQTGGVRLLDQQP